MKEKVLKVKVGKGRGKWIRMEVLKEGKESVKLICLVVKEWK